MSLFKIEIREESGDLVFEHYAQGNFKGTQSRPCTLESFFEHVHEECVLNESVENSNAFFNAILKFDNWNETFEFKFVYDGNQFYFDKKFIIFGDALDIEVYKSN